MDMVFRPSLVLDSNAGDAAKNFPLALRIYAASTDKTDIARQRYRAFQAAGWIPPNSAEEFVDDYDQLPSTFSIAAFHNGTCIGSVRLAFGGSGHPTGTMPCESQFPNEMQELNPDREKKLVEFSRMAIEPVLTNRSFRTTLYATLVRASVILSTAADADIAVVGVHRMVSRFYQAMCGFQVIGRSARYAEIQEPTDLLAVRFNEIEQRRRRSNAFFAVSDVELSSARDTLKTLQCAVRT
jgi:N-acyl-L-homoserine lactone synthetase